MARHNEYGKWGEDVAADYLVEHGYRIVERNWKAGHKEIDIIATNGRILIFVEVKARLNTNFGLPHESVNWEKKKYLMFAMNRYLMTHNVKMPVRYDIVSIIGTAEDYSIELLENAVSNFT